MHCVQTMWHLAHASLPSWLLGGCCHHYPTIHHLLRVCRVSSHQLEWGKKGGGCTQLAEHQGCGPVHGVRAVHGQRPWSKPRRRTLPRPAGHPLSFDHGAQFFSAGSPDFQAEVAAWAEAGVAQEWRCRHGRIAAGAQPQGRLPAGPEQQRNGCNQLSCGHSWAGVSAGRAACCAVRPAFGAGGPPSWLGPGCSAWQGLVAALLQHASNPACIGCPPVRADGTFHPHEPGSSDGGGGRPVLLRAAPGGDQRWVGVPSNAAIMQHIAGELQAAGGRQHEPQGRPLFELLSGLVVRSAERLGTSGCGSHGSTRWRLHGSRAERAAAAVPAHLLDGQEDLGGYDAVILADAMPLVPGSAGHVRGLEAASTSLGQLARSVQAVAAQPRFALMVAFHQPLRGVPFDFASVEHSSSSSGDGTGGGRSCGSCGCGSCGTGSGGAFALVACNSSKPGRPGSGDAGSASSGGVGDALECWVAISTAQRARQLLDQHPLVGPDGRHNPQTEQYRAEVAEELLADFRDLMAPFVQVGGRGKGAQVETCIAVDCGL